MADDASHGDHRLVKLWFGQHVIKEYDAEPTQAERYASAIQRRFAGLNVTIENPTDSNAPPLPAEHWWELIPQ